VILIKRPVITILIGAIIGIIYGLYLKISIAISIIILSLLLFLIKKYKKRTFYFFAKRKRIILLIFISILISSLYTVWINSKYEKIYKEIPKNIKTLATIVSESKETEYYYSYEIKIQNKKFIMYVKKNYPIKLSYGMSISLEAEYIKPQGERNYKGFNYKEYLKTKKIYGSFKANEISVIKENDISILLQHSNKIRNKIIETANNMLPERTRGLLVAMLIGETQGISDELSESFSKSSLSHIVAISGSHISYIIIALSFLLTKSRIPKRGVYNITIIALILFMFITRFSPSIVRACIMGIIMLFSKVVYRKLDILNSISVSLIIILIDNPFAIKDIGLQLSYFGTLGIIYLNNPISKFLEKYMNNKIAEILSVTLSAQIAVLPIIAINFNVISTIFLISNLIAVPLSGIIILLGYVNVFIGIIFLRLGKIVAVFLHSLVQILIWTAEITAKIPYASIIIITPSIIKVIMYYIILISAYKKKYVKQVICISLAILVIILSINIIPQKLKIHFIDVGQRRFNIY